MRPGQFHPRDGKPADWNLSFPSFHGSNANRSESSPNTPPGRRTNDLVSHQA
jgi:hypothetical protein